MAGLVYGTDTLGGSGTGASTASPAAAYSASGGGNSGGGGKGSSTPKGSYLGGPSISAEDFNSALRSDAAAAYKQGPTQTTYSGLSDASKGAIAGLNNAAASIVSAAHHYFPANLAAQAWLQPGYYRLEVYAAAGSDAADDRDDLGDVSDYNQNNIHQFWATIY